LLLQAGVGVVEILNNDYLKSELTQMYYDSLAKDEIPQGG
jgi:hypothetical protein